MSYLGCYILFLSIIFLLICCCFFLTICRYLCRTARLILCYSCWQWVQSQSEFMSLNDPVFDSYIISLQWSGVKIVLHSSFNFPSSSDWRLTQTQVNEVGDLRPSTDTYWWIYISTNSKDFTHYFTFIHASVVFFLNKIQPPDTDFSFLIETQLHHLISLSFHLTISRPPFITFARSVRKMAEMSESQMYYFLL